jgi:beta-N-acetylhexosaminidase
MRARPGDALAVGFDGTSLPDDLLALAETAGLGGVILFARNCPTLEAVLALTAAVRALGPDVLVLVDHEGGRVHRLPPPFTRFPPAAVVARGADLTLVTESARAMARELRAAGFDSGLAPVLDCLTDPGCAVIGDRAFAADPDTVATCGAAFVTGMLTESVIPVAKHFPGHGRTRVDSHLDLPEIAAPVDLLEAVEITPFARAFDTGCPAVMVAHARYLALDPVWPASLSPAVIRGLLRGRLAFDGLVLSDDLEMGAVVGRFGVEFATRRFLEAGGDLALVCRAPRSRGAALAAVEAAVADGLSLEPARARRAGLRARVSREPRPPVGVIGCAEHRALAEEVARRGAAARP